MAPQAMVGRTRAPGSAHLPFLVPVAQGLPELGRLTGRGGTLNLEVSLKTNPDLIHDYGTVNPSCVDLADRVMDQSRIPCVLIDGSLTAMPAALRTMGRVMGVPARGEALAA